MSINIYRQWVELYFAIFNTNSLIMQRLGNLLLDGASKWPNDLKLNFFIACLLTKTGDSNSIVQKYFDNALMKKFTNINDDNVAILMDFWELYIDWSLMKKISPKKILNIVDYLNKILINSPRIMAEYFKEKTLIINYQIFGIKKTRIYYKNFKSKSPITKGFFTKMIEIEKHVMMEDNSQHFQYIYEDLVHYFGAEDIQVWLDYIDYAMKFDMIFATSLYQKALKYLRPSLCSDFIEKYNLSKFSIIKC